MEVNMSRFKLGIYKIHLILPMISQYHPHVFRLLPINKSTFNEHNISQELLVLSLKCAVAD